MRAPLALMTGFLMVAGAMAAEAAPKDEPNARLLGCYKKVYVEPVYDVKHVLVKPAEKKYIRRGQIIELWEYPAVYREDKTLIKDGHHVMQEVACPKR